MPRRALLTASGAALVWTQAGYGLALALLRRARRHREVPLPTRTDARPRVSLIVAAYREEAVIAAKVANALALHWPRDRLEVIVAVDGGVEPGADGTRTAARAAGADIVLALPRGGKVRAQDAAVDSATGELLVFSDANAAWEPDALEPLVAPFEDPRVGYVCGRVTFVNAGGTNQEGIYWRYELWLRAQESALASVTAGNGAIYAVRPEAYLRVDPVMGHDLSLPFNLVKRGWRARYAREARATEKMVPSVEGEWVRKRRMMSHAWPIVLRGGLLNQRGYGPLYGAMIVSHRVLRYAAPGLHALFALASLSGAARGRRLEGALTAAQAALALAAVAGARRPARPLLLARYYVLTQGSIAAGLLDHLRHGTPAGWDAPEGTR